MERTLFNLVDPLRARTLGARRSLPLTILVASLAALPALTLADSPPKNPDPLSQFTNQFEEPLVATAPRSVAEDQALLRAIRAYRQQTTVDDLSIFHEFLTEFPDSGWRVSLLTNLGLSYYHYGYFSRAIDAWEQAWKAGKPITERRAKALVDRAVGELARMHARLGHADELRALFQEIGTRPVTGQATEAIAGATDGLWAMENQPGIAYLCGPMALKNLLLARGARRDQVAFLDAYRSGPHGVTLAEVSRLAAKAGLKHRVVFREANQPIPVPSIVHWKVTHFAAIVGEAGGRFHITDPTFGTDLWVSRTAVEAESSGYFLIPAEQKAADWRLASRAEAGQIRGMGRPTGSNPRATGPCDKKAKGGCGCGNHGMCGYDMHEMLVSLNLMDTPVGYAPAIGPHVFVTLTYNQREAGQPANFSFFNVSQKWNMNWLSYVEDDPIQAGSNVVRQVAGGGSVAYSDFVPSTGAFKPEAGNGSVLVRFAASPIQYHHKMPDGSLEVYDQSNNATSYPRRVFLTKIVDQFGNAVSLTYDGQQRLTKITDATIRETTFSYELTDQPLLVTKITDPFGRIARLVYDAQGRLFQIVDVLGLTSEFAYDAASLINSMTTAYGTTHFAYGQAGTQRWLEITDPLGSTERLEFRQDVPTILRVDPPAIVPKGISLPNNNWLDARNTFYWDKHAFQIAAGDYTKARIRHWTHADSSLEVTGNTVESMKFPLENRIWFSYPGQSSATVVGTLDQPNRTGRVLDNGVTQLTQVEYNGMGYVTRRIDPAVRETVYEYDANQIDLLRIKQKTTSNPDYSTIQEYTYNSQHLPTTSTDAAGRVSTSLYNPAGQLTKKTNPLGQNTAWEYDSLGRLTRIVNNNNQAAASFTYDQFNRVYTRTDSQGYTVTFTYDALDRVLQEAFPDGTTRQYTYDKLDLVSVKDRQGRITQSTYDATRNLVEVTDPLGRKTKYGRYANGLLKTLTDPNDNVTTWDIDVQGRVIAKRYADGRQTAITYENTTSRVKSTTDALGQTKSYTYTIDDRTARIDYTNAVNSTPAVQFTYHRYFPRVATMTDGTGTTQHTTQYTFFPPGVRGALRLLKEDGPNANDAITYEYDALGRVIGQTVDTSTETFTYDGIGRVKSHVSPLGTFDLTYLGQTAQLTSQRLHGGTLGTTWTYDNNINDRRLKSIVTTGATRGYQYTTTPENIITAIAETAGSGSAWPAQTWNYGYDDADRLSTAHASGGANYGYSFDAADNITSQTGPSGTKAAIYNSVNQITAFNGQNFVHDANGNVLDDGIRTYKWDAENRLIQVEFKAPPLRSTVYRYDGLDRRIAIVATDSSGSIETRFLWCGESICQQRSLNDGVARRFYGEGEVIPASGTLLYYSKDHLGSVRDILVIPTGALVASYDYDPFGNMSRKSGQIANAFRYAYRYGGLFYDQFTGLHLAHYRAYESNTERWLSRDPIGESRSPGLHSYVANNPLNRRDTVGLWTTESVGAIAYNIGAYGTGATGATLNWGGEVGSSLVGGFGDSFWIAGEGIGAEGATFFASSFAAIAGSGVVGWKLGTWFNNLPGLCPDETIGDGVQFSFSVLIQKFPALATPVPKWLQRLGIPAI